MFRCENHYFQIGKDYFCGLLDYAFTTDGGDGIIKSSCPLLNLYEDDESCPLHHLNSPNAHLAKVPNIVVAFPCLATSVVPVRFHYQLIETFWMTN
jgi:hypothetical protein